MGMESGQKTIRALAHELYALMPHAMSRETLSDYGIMPSVDRTRLITLEVLYVNLFYVVSAMEALLSQRERFRLLEELRGLLRATWTTELQLGEEEFQRYEREFEIRRRAYAQIVDQGGSPVSVFSEAASLLEMNKGVEGEDRMKMVALLVDVIPVDVYGDLMQDIDLVDQ
jgi:hypothetical protein